MNIINLCSLNLNANQKLFDVFKKSYLKSNLPNATIIYWEKGIGKATFVKYFINQIFNNFLNW